jgi:threonine aldolase
MTNFNISFNFQEVEYTGNVQKVPFVNNFPVQFHVNNIKLVIPEVPDPYIFIHEPKKDIFEFGDYNGSVELPEKILDAIKKYCKENEISLTT